MSENILLKDFCVFILTHGRPNKVITYNTLEKQGYTGDIHLIIDDEDIYKEEYLDRFKNVHVISKKEIALTFDEADNFGNRKTIVYARNACFEIAQKYGYKYFLQLDDDYSRFEYRLYFKGHEKPILIKNLDSVILAILDFYKASKLDCVALAQGGDFIGGKNNKFATSPTLFRKCMNSFFCSIDRPFKFIGRINEDVNTYTKLQNIGLKMGTIPFVSIVQGTTQKNKGGMTDTYLDSGTYIKSFYSVLFMPSSVSISTMGETSKRIHHRVDWDRTAPKILRK